MHLLSIPRHQLETTLSDYARIASSLLAPADCPDAVDVFERDFAAYLGCRHAIAVSSGRLGLHLLLEALDLSADDEVIVPAFNLFAVVERFCQRGLVPRFGDIRRHDLNLDPAAAERLVTPRSKVLLVTHMFGHPADLDALGRLARRNDLILLEDCAHALGAQHGSRFVGTFGKAAIFSFSVLKLVTTFGGGMIATDDNDLASRIRARLARLRETQPRPRALKKLLTGTVMDLGTRRWPFSLAAWPALRLARILRPDFQQRIMTETPHPDRAFRPESVPPLHPFQARLGRSQLARVENLIERRRTVSQWLTDQLHGIPQITPLAPAAGSSALSGSPPKGCRWNGLYYGVLADRAAELREHLFRRGIDSETSEYLNCADLPMYRDHHLDPSAVSRSGPNRCPVARDVQARILRLPNFPAMTPAHASRIALAIRRFYP